MLTIRAADNQIWIGTIGMQSQRNRLHINRARINVTTCNVFSQSSYCRSYFFTGVLLENQNERQSAFGATVFHVSQRLEVYVGNILALHNNFDTVPGKFAQAIC